MNATESANELLTLASMARHLRVAQSWLRREAKEGRIPSLEANGRFLFARTVVEQVLIERASQLQKKGTS